ncbi:ribonuclease P protein subunit rpr2 [Vanessa atalanta]|uniref:ribonuclease P protein subunit rpr2 n=1 Tax=Vanessa atalanta TaxID=42275 RepID=UPI001FCD5970|nr:ribonuclease P protein subunit rpr2 [Vanessa atalanta]
MLSPMQLSKKIQGNDSSQRINYLYQISKKVVEKNPVLSAYYGNLAVSVAKKNVLKIHPDIKRQLCKKCRCMLIDKKSAKVKIKNKKKTKYIQVTCNTCKMTKYFPANKGNNHRLWLENPEAIVEIVN